MTDPFLPRPGTRLVMVCPLEIALHRDSGACRMFEPDDPELEAIGDARDVITMQRVYRLSTVLWRGPGAHQQTQAQRQTRLPKPVSAPPNPHTKRVPPRKDCLTHTHLPTTTEK